MLVASIVFTSQSCEN